MSVRSLARLAGLLVLILAGPARAEIIIGVAGPMSGQFAAFGEQMRIGAEEAAADINASGGINGETIVLRIEDDKCTDEQALAVANQFVGMGAGFVVGHVCFNASIAGSKVYADRQIIQISPATTNNAYTDERPGPGIFRIARRDDGQGKAAGDFLAREFADKRIAIIHDGSVYGRGLADATRAAMKAAGKTEELYESYEPGRNDYSVLVSRLNQEGVEVVFIGGYHAEAAVIRRQMSERGLEDAVVMGGDALMAAEFGLIAGDAAEGTLIVLPADPIRNAAAVPVVAQLQQAGKSAEGYTLHTYAALETIAQAAKKAGSTEFEAIVEAMNEMEFDTVVGPFTFDGKGDATRDGYAVYRWTDGRAVPE
ncbi:branched-chain amino acid ABC transporter substrate-binding protein [Rhizobiales bacterium]|uniref:branched-chain amino acid ABC transporter substrate-binding protein n=1 Tax=Hongsoonwoonella zoysiae TaxID=2821844 RepID=UPI0015617544|nr:branched-chain amino acid ABC transporter substrate-binding protein [Hongsoonwoonella zoysiae]NRG18088.1 branched-chain amino acid ABC transporter substrate-binding protein [Hongsoonwoonella zoysiae]